MNKHPEFTYIYLAIRNPNANAEPELFRALDPQWRSEYRFYLYRGKYTSTIADCERHATLECRQIISNKLVFGVCTCVRACERAVVSECVRVHVCIRVRVFVCTYVCMCVYVVVCIRVCLEECACVHSGV